MGTTSPAAASLAALAALLASGCGTIHHRCDVPQPVVEALPSGPRLPLAVAVRTSSRATPSEIVDQRDEGNTWGVDPVPPTRTMLERLAGSVFARVIPAPADPAAPAPAADASLELRVEDLRFAWEPVGFAPYHASVTYRATVRAGDGAVVSAFVLAGEGGRAPVMEPVTHCKGIGQAVALAMQDAGAKLVARLGSDAALASWLGARGLAAPVLAVRPRDAYPATPPARPPGPDGPYVPPGMEVPDAAPSPAAPAARPVAAPAPGSPQTPRQVHVWFGGGVFEGDETAGALQDPGTGFTLTILGAEWRPRPFVGLTVELGTYGADYSARVRSPSGAVTPSGLFLGATTLGLGVRGILPVGPVEPWVGATGLVILSELSGSYDIPALSGNTGQEAEASAGFDLGGGLLLYAGRFRLGLEVRRIVARASFDTLAAPASIGGWTTSVTVGLAAP